MAAAPSVLCSGWQSWLAGRNTGGASGRVGKKRIQPQPPLNARQLKTHDILTAIAKPEKSGRLTVSILHQELADHHGCCRKTIVRDFAHLKARGYVRIVGQKNDSGA